jgi:drug/metabolite transporter (DMT)-like permease
MWLAFALAAALLTSFLPIVNKRLLADTPVAVVAWGINALSLPVLGLVALIVLPVPRVDGGFVLAVLASAVLNLIATLASTQALKLGDASLVTPLLTFNPAFTLLVGAMTLGERPSALGVAGVVVVLLGGYVLNVQEIAAGWWRPLAALVTEPAMGLAVGASFIWGLTPVAEKIAIQHAQPANPPLVAFGSTALMAVFLLPPVLRSPRPARFIATHRRGFLVAATIAGIAPIFGFNAIAIGLVGYVSAIFKLSTVLSVIWAILVLGERATPKRLVAAGLMVVGALLIGG